MVKRLQAVQKSALIECALFCDWSLGQVDGDPRDFCLVSKRGKSVDYTSNLAVDDKLGVAEMLMNVARRLLDAHVAAHGE